jgi:hypothetical protein
MVRRGEDVLFEWAGWSKEARGNLKLKKPTCPQCAGTG